MHCKIGNQERNRHNRIQPQQYPVQDSFQLIAYLSTKLPLPENKQGKVDGFLMRGSIDYFNRHIQGVNCASGFP